MKLKANKIKILGEIYTFHELKPNEYNIEKLYRKNNKHYAVYLIQGERWQYPLSEKLYSELLQEFRKGEPKTELVDTPIPEIEQDDLPF